MSLFTNNKNQQMLWDIINKNDKITNSFYSIQEKQEWFRNIIQYFDSNNPVIHTIDKLKSQNLQALQFMAQDIKSRFNQIQQQQQQQPPQQQINSIQEQTYEDREREYNKLLEKPQPKQSVNFQEDVSNVVISQEEITRRENERNNEIPELNNPIVNEFMEFKKNVNEQQDIMKNDIINLQTKLQICMDTIQKLSKKNDDINTNKPTILSENTDIAEEKENNQIEQIEAI